MSTEGAASGAARSEPVLRVRQVSKRFGEVRALEDVSLDLRAGEVHCLLGENGAGKSTLIGLLTGLHRPDRGAIEIDGERTALGSPAAAIALGIGAVAQHSALVPTMTVLENLMLADAAKPRLLLDRPAAQRRLIELVELLGSDIDPDAPVGELGLGQQQQLEIARALWQRPRVLILDEPTSMLPERGVEALVRSIRRLTGRGVAVLFVTHKLHEALRLADSVTVLRAGEVTAGLPAARLAVLDPGAVRTEILEAMFGAGSAAQQGTDEARPPSPAQRAAGSPRLLVLDRVRTRDAGGGAPLDGVTLEVGAGETLGVAGIDGNGQRHLAEVVAGQRRAAAGRVLFEGRDVASASVRERQGLGMRYVTDDRLGEGIVDGFSVALNLLLKRIGERPLWRFGRMNRRTVRAETQRLVDEGDIRTSSLETRAGTLSGGNIQKILLARELQGSPKAVVFHKPSTGLDLRTAIRVHDAMRDFAAGGGAALVISSDLDELLSLSHRIAVIAHGRIVGEVANDPARDAASVRAELGALMAGATLAAEAGEGS